MKITIAALLLFSTSSAFALDCKNAISTPDINQCAKFEQEKVEKELNAVYHRILSIVSEAEKEDSTENLQGLKKEFIEAQRQWIKFRELDCSAVYTFHAGGTIRGLMRISCLQTRAEQRIKELKEYEQTY